MSKWRMGLWIQSSKSDLALPYSGGGLEIIRGCYSGDSHAGWERWAVTELWLVSRPVTNLGYHGKSLTGESPKLDSSSTSNSAVFWFL